ncbi:class I SAM-dependent methyltransferase [archaeon]|nr:class I SAM-dependent methyltransferase [archaeon]
MNYINRHDLIFKWLSNSKNILDVGCAYGESARKFSRKSKNVYCIDPNQELIKKAKKNNPNIFFKIGSAEKIPFKDKSFDVVILSDVIEHVDDEKKSLDEIYRVLKSKGTLILTTPHKGLFSFMDVDNYSWHYRRFLKIKTNKPGYKDKHRHYSLEDIKNLFNNKFKISKIYRSSLFLLPFTSNLRLLIRHTLSKNVESKIKPYLNKICEWDYSNQYGRMSYCIGVYAKKV